MRGFLVGRHLDAGAGDHLAQVSLRQAAVVFVTRYIEQYVAFRLIGMAAVDQRLDHFDHFSDMLRGKWLDVRRQHPERAHVVVVSLDVFRGNLVDRLPGLYRHLVDLVIDIRDVAGERKFVAPPEHPCQQIEYDGRTGVADMGIVVDGRTAQVHRDLLVVEGFEGHLLALSRIVQVNRHAVRVSGRPKA